MLGKFSKVKRARKHGYRSRTTTSRGRKVLAGRRRKGRKVLSVSVRFQKGKKR